MLIPMNPASLPLAEPESSRLAARQKDPGIRGNSMCAAKPEISLARLYNRPLLESSTLGPGRTNVPQIRPQKGFEADKGRRPVGALIASTRDE